MESLPRPRPVDSSSERDDRPEVQKLFANLRSALPELEKLLEHYRGRHLREDGVYRFYHQSFKVYGLQGVTASVVAALGALAPGRTLNERFMTIVREGTGKTFEPGHNARWLEVTRPIVEAYFHAGYFLEVAVRYGRELEYPPRLLPSGWAALLYLYGLR